MRISDWSSDVCSSDLSCGADQGLREIGMDPPVTAFIGIGQRAAGDAATDPQVKQLGLVCAQAQLDVAQALAAGKLGERHAQELVQARKAFDVTLPVVLGDQSSKRVQRQMLH